MVELHGNVTLFVIFLMASLSRFLGSMACFFPELATEDWVKR